MSWAIHFRTKAKLGNHILSRHIKFVDGKLTIRDNEHQAAEVLSRKDRGREWGVESVEGDVPVSLLSLVNNSPLGTFSKDFPSTMRAEEMVESVAGNAPAEQHGVEVVKGQDEMPSSAETDALVREKPEQKTIPDVNVTSQDDLFLLDRAGLEKYAKEVGITRPEDFRNDDLLIEAIIATLEAHGRIKDGTILDAEEEVSASPGSPEEPVEEVVQEEPIVTVDIPSKSALKRMSRGNLEKFVRKLNRVEGVNLGNPKGSSYPNKNSLVEAILKLKG